MGRFLTGLFTTSGKPASPAATSFRLQSSIYGNPIPLLVAGQQRVPGNLLGYYNFTSVTLSSSGQAGGKGGFFATSGAGGQDLYYYASIMFGLCEGPVSDVVAIWPYGKPRSINSWAQSFDTTAVTVSPTTFKGTYTQDPWGFVEARRPDQALSYRGICYEAVANYPLGTAASLPNVNWEVLATNSYAAGPSGPPDGEASRAFSDFLTNQYWGLNFPADRLGSLDLFKNYCLANGLLVSWYIGSAVQASSALQELLDATNSTAVWSSGLLTVIPYGDQPVVVGQVQQATEPTTIPPSGSGLNGTLTVDEVATFVANVQVFFTGTGQVLTEVAPGFVRQGQYSVQNGVYKFTAADYGKPVTVIYTWAATASYQPNTTPIYDLTLDDFMPSQGSIGQGTAEPNVPLIVARKPRDQMLNSVKVEYLDRNNAYNPNIIEVKDEASINLYGRYRPASVRQMHLYCLAAAAQYSATQLLVRQTIPRMYQFTVGRQFILLDIANIVTVSDPAQNIFRQPVRLTEIQENSDRSLTMTAEEFPGTAAAPLFGTEAPVGYQAANDADPGNINPPIIFEPTAELLGGASQEVWCAVSGGPNWGGCFVWLSSDGGNTYLQVPGMLAGPARMGVTTSALASVTVNQVGQTIDQVSRLGVNLAESLGILASGSTADAQALRTACYVGGEIVAYATATLTSTSNYTLAYLVRGAYGTESDIVDHPVGTPFCRLDAGIFQIPFNQTDIDQTIFIKFQSFNLFGQAAQPLSDVGAYPYVVQGTALSSPLPTVQNVTTALVDSRLVMSWDEISTGDFRNGIFYEIRAGTGTPATPDASITIAIVAHPPFVLPAGTNTYFISGWCQPVPGLIVRSEDWSSLDASNLQVTTNIVQSYDLKGLGWPGSFTNGAGIDTGLNAVRTGGTGNILADAVLATIVAGTYSSGSGLVSLQLSGTHGISQGASAIITSATGTGSFALINGTHTAAAGTASTELTFGIATGQTLTISGGQYISADILNQGGEESGTYTPGLVVDVGRVVACPVYVSTTGTGVPVGQDILAVSDILSMADVLGSASAAYVNVYPEIAFGASSNPTNWQKFVPGTFLARYFAIRWQLVTLDPNTIAYLLAATFAVDVPDRIDNPLVNGTVTSLGLGLTWTPNGTSVAAGFHGGPNGNVLPAVEVTWSGADAAAGDFEKTTSLTLTGGTVTIYNSASVAVTRGSVNIYVYGW